MKAETQREIMDAFNNVLDKISNNNNYTGHDMFFWAYKSGKYKNESDRPAYVFKVVDGRIEFVAHQDAFGGFMSNASLMSAMGFVDSISVWRNMSHTRDYVANNWSFNVVVKVRG